jgi:tRNA dimethylallyltransferase
LIIILGPTASGKTELAVQLACRMDGEIISADSRQVYRGMTIGTGKDLGEYIVHGHNVPYHLIDIREPGYEYNVYEFLRDFTTAFLNITGRGKIPVLCGGTGMYIDAVLKGYKLPEIRNDRELLKDLKSRPDIELSEMLRRSGTLHNTTDLLDRDRMIRALFIAKSRKEGETFNIQLPEITSTIIGIRIEREILRKRITERLEKRLNEGMMDEVKSLLEKGLTPAQLKFYGLEYRYVTSFLEKKLSYDEMLRLLNIAIHQFAKRQMTWFRKMEREGHPIHWIDGSSDPEEKIRLSLGVINT